ncbi:hypothetical protein EJ04DRAFT_569267 [Polyplosphaeria fusca]|uniref:Uncharacterized protein n=1 Tax=Polyplosphaeria fusca TaxID=682080 RepID=A0A9P4QNR8_9PLEO|nr:hypothetical protein EJ04DRAFT_569267 [Polyplosphaeria fusca]
MSPRPIQSQSGYAKPNVQGRPANQGRNDPRQQSSRPHPIRGRLTAAIAGSEGSKAGSKGSKSADKAHKDKPGN